MKQTIRSPVLFTIPAFFTDAALVAVETFERRAVEAGVTPNTEVTV